MTDVTMGTGTGEAGVDDALMTQFVVRARAGGLKLTGEGGLLQQLTKRAQTHQQNRHIHPRCQSKRATSPFTQIARNARAATRQPAPASTPPTVHGSEGASC